MAKRKGSGSSSPPLPSEGEEKRERTKVDYVFEEHKEDGTVTPLGLTMNYPGEVQKVKAYLETIKEAIGIEGDIKVCKKIYS